MATISPGRGVNSSRKVPPHVPSAKTLERAAASWVGAKNVQVS
jgi:hypothetical protein